jgi:hypothetical protein
MKTNKIDLHSFLSKGHVVSSVANNEPEMTTAYSIKFKTNGIGHKKCGNEMLVPSYIYLPDKYKLPLRIDMTVKMDTPSLHFMLSDGHLTFGKDSLDHIDFTDISGEGHASARRFKNYIPYNEYFSISLIFGFSYMQVMIDGEIRYFSEKEKYMKSKTFLEKNKEGLEIKLTCDKRSKLWIRDFCVIEYENDIPECDTPTRNMLPPPGLPEEVRNEIEATHDFIKNLKPLKLKRKIQNSDCNKNIVYISEYGFSYVIQTQHNSATHHMGWILYNTKREQEKYGGIRKRELTNETLIKLAETSPDFANLMYNNLTECNAACGCNDTTPKACNSDYCIHCEHKTNRYCSTLITYNGKKKAVCHGRMGFNMTSSDFADARKVIEAVNELLKEYNED